MKRFNAYILLGLLFFPIMSVMGEISKKTNYTSESKENLDNEDIEMVTDYDLLEVFALLEEWDLFDNYEVFVDTITE